MTNSMIATLAQRPFLNFQEVTLHEFNYTLHHIFHSNRFLRFVLSSSKANLSNKLNKIKTKTGLGGKPAVYDFQFYFHF